MKTSVPTWIIESAHRKADETGIEHAVSVCVSASPVSGERGVCWVAVPLGAIPEEEWNHAPYVAIPGELA